jgi:hypothetical protein
MLQGRREGQNKGRRIRRRRTNGSPRGARPRGPGGRTPLGHRPPDRSGSSRRPPPAPVPTKTPAARPLRRRDPYGDTDPISPRTGGPAMGLARKVGNGMPDRVEWERWRGRGQLSWRNRAAKGIGEWCSGARTRSEEGGRAVGVAGIREGCCLGWGGEGRRAACCRMTKRRV